MATHPIKPAKGSPDEPDATMEGVTTTFLHSTESGDAPTGGPRLVMLVGERPGRTFDLRAEQFIGRATDCEVRLGDESVSRRHAVIRAGDGGLFVLEDLGSRNGTWVNGLPVDRRELALGDRIRIGSHSVLLYSAEDDLEARVLHHQRMEALGELSSGVAHDFNNLLAAVIGNVSWLLAFDPQRPLEDPEVRACLGDVQTAGRRAAQLARQLLDFARRGPHQESPVDLSHLVPELVNMMRRTFPANVRVEVDVEPGLVVRGDTSQLHQVLMNLCINARDAMPEGGVLRLRGSRRLAKGTPEIVLEVSDTGEGMTEDVKKRAFEPFFTTKARGHGTGLGLSTVYGVVQQHGGAVHLESSPGAGSRFELVLPAQHRPERHIHTTQTTVVLAPPAARRGVLVVDIDSLHARTAGRLLSQLGRRVLSASSAAEALECLGSHGADVAVVLMDVDLPDLSPAELIARIADLDPAIRVVVTAGKPDAEGTSGAAAFLPKPYDRSDLEEALARALKG